jgi:hypothetical protein
MGSGFAGNVQVVVATKGSETEYWVVTGARIGAASIVKDLIHPDWTVSLAERCLTPDQISALKLRPGGIRARKLEYVP